MTSLVLEWLNIGTDFLPKSKIVEVSMTLKTIYGNFDKVTTNSDRTDISGSYQRIFIKEYSNNVDSNNYYYIFLQFLHQFINCISNF